MTDANRKTQPSGKVENAAESDPSDKAIYVLVHGAWHGSWCWKRVRKALQDAGHEVFTPTLTGLGERSHLNSVGVNLSTHIADIVGLIRWEELSDVILCGHSYSGLVISGVADQIPDRIRALVYLDAYVPEDGESMLDLLPPAWAQGLREQAQLTGDGWRVPPIPAELFSIADPQVVAWVNRQCSFQSLASLEERIRLTGSADRVKNNTHILATGSGDISPMPPMHERAKVKGWRTLTVSCGHEVMLDIPNELTRMLLASVIPTSPQDVEAG